MSAEKILGVVMAGGASRRMGFDKCRLEFEGQTLVARSGSVLAPVCDEVVVSIQPDSAGEYGLFRAIRDRRAHSGPLAGLESTLEEGAVRGGSVFLLACDLPHVGTDVVRHLLDCARDRGDYAAVVPSIEGRRQPLCALYRASALAAVSRQLESGERSMRALLDVISVLVVELSEELPFFRTDLFRNLNRPADLVGVVHNIADGANIAKSRR